MGFKIDEIVHPDSRGVAQQFECSVCMCVVNEPLQTVCDHIFCAECISTCLACPTCRTAFGEGACKPLRDCNRPLMRMIHNLQVWCPYHAESKFVPPDEDESADDTEIVEDVDEPAAKKKRVDSCDWSGSYSDLLAKHLAMCEHHFVPCPRGCGRQVRRGGLEAHAPVCAKNFETCKLCHEAVRVGDMSQHRQDKAELHVQLLEARLAERGDGGDLQRSLERIHERLANLESARVQPSLPAPSIWRWTVTNMPARLAATPKGRSIVSPGAYLCGHGPFKMKYYPNGNSQAPHGMSSLFCEGPAYLAARMRFSVGDWSQSSRRFHSYGSAQGYRLGPPVPIAVDSVTIVMELLQIEAFSETR